MKNTAKNRIKARKAEKDYLVIGNMNCILNDILAELRKVKSTFGYTQEQPVKELDAVDKNEQDFTEEYTDENGDLVRKNDEGQFHSLFSPAVEYLNGDKHWYKDGKRHREDGPAIEYSDGSKVWYLNGKLYGSSTYDYTQEQFEKDLKTGNRL